MLFREWNAALVTQVTFAAPGILSSIATGTNPHAILSFSLVHCAISGSDHLLPCFLRCSRTAGNHAEDSEQGGPRLSRARQQDADSRNRQGGSCSCGQRKGKVHASDWRQSFVGKSGSRCHREMEMGTGCAGNQRAYRTEFSSLAPTLVTFRAFLIPSRLPLLPNASISSLLVAALSEL